MRLRLQAQGTCRLPLKWFLLGASVAAAYWPGLLGEALVPRWAVIAVGLPLTSTLDPRWLPVWVRGLLLWILGLAALSLVVSPDPWGGAGELIFIVILSLVCVAGSALDDLRPVMTGLGAGLALSAILCIMQGFGGRPVAQGSPAPPGLFYNSEILGEFAAILFVWAALRSCWWMAAVVGVCVVSSQSRIALFVIALGLAYGIVRRPWLRAIFFTAALCGGLLTLWFFGLEKLGSAIQRVVIWLALSEAITPLGHGLGWVYVALPRQQFAHSDALQALVELGFGAVFLIFLPIWVFWQKRGGIAERAAFFAGCAEVLVSFPLRVPAQGFVVALLAGFLASSRDLVRMGLPDGRTDDGPAIRRWNASAWRGLSVGGRRRRPLSVRSRLAQLADLRAIDHLPGWLRWWPRPEPEGFTWILALTLALLIIAGVCGQFL